MKRIGLLGGTSWPSTIRYYRMLNEMVYDRLAGRHSANIILRSIDFHEMRSNYKKDWNLVKNHLKEHLEDLASMRPDVILICNNTLHKALDAIRDDLSFNIPIIHMVKETAIHIKTSGTKRILLLGTQMTMEDEEFAGYFREFGIDVDIPTRKDRQKIQKLQTKTALMGRVFMNDKEDFEEIIAPYSKGVDNIVLCCTELPLLVPEDCKFANMIIDPIAYHCRGAVNFALDKD